MIDKVANFIRFQLNQALKNQYNTDEDLVVLSDFSEAASLVTTNRVVTTLINIERDSFPNEHTQPVVVRGRTAARYRPINLHLYLMFIANFSGEKYGESLKFISSTIQFFQASPVFERGLTADLPNEIEKIILEIENLNLRELHNIWTLITGNYMPSVVFKVRMITYDEGVRGYDPVVEGVDYPS